MINIGLCLVENGRRRKYSRFSRLCLGTMCLENLFSFNLSLIGRGVAREKFKFDTPLSK